MMYVEVAGSHALQSAGKRCFGGFAVDTVIIDPDLWILSKTKISIKTNTQLLPPDDVQLTPNPAPNNAVVRVRNTTGTRLTVGRNEAAIRRRLFNAAGQLLLRRDVNTGVGADVQVDIPFMRYPRGVYMVDIRNDKSLKVIRRVVH